jgi:hypothetical protein
LEIILATKEMEESIVNFLGLKSCKTRRTQRYYSHLLRDPRNPIKNGISLIWLPVSSARTQVVKHIHDPVGFCWLLKLKRMAKNQPDSMQRRILGHSRSFLSQDL